MSALDPLLPPFGDVPMDAHAADDLTRSILARTSGSPCQRLRDLACDYVDGTLEAGKAALVQGHLEHCGGCAVLVTTLAAMAAALPALAEVDPGPWFTTQVLRETVRRPQPVGVWWKLIHRPRIALEAAYLGAAGSFLGIAFPLPVFHGDTPRPAVILKVCSPRAAVSALEGPVRRVTDPVAQAGRRTFHALRRSFLPLGASLRSRLGSQARREEAGEKPGRAPNP